MTAYSAARAAHDTACTIAHVEAGLRTDAALEPFPEEWFRRRIARYAHIHFAPSASAVDNLIAEGIDALAAKCLPDIQRAVKWGMAYYGVDGGWCFASGAFVGHVKLMFIRGTEIKPEPPVTPIGMGKCTRGVELASVDDFDERQLASWIKQAATMPFVGGKKR